jgi:hypothetical protein
MRSQAARTSAANPSRPSRRIGGTGALDAGHSGPIGDHQAVVVKARDEASTAFKPAIERLPGHAALHDDEMRRHIKAQVAPFNRSGTAHGHSLLVGISRQE